MEDPLTPIPTYHNPSVERHDTIPATKTTASVATSDQEELDNEQENQLKKTLSNSTVSSASQLAACLPDNCTLASSKDNAYFHALFKSVPEQDHLIEIYKCALHRDILLQGHLYLSEHYVCFHANIFGWITNLVIEFNEITSIERKMTAMIIPNGIQINTQHARHTFASFIFREAAYQQLTSLWELHQPQKLTNISDDDSWTTSGSDDDDNSVVSTSSTNNRNDSSMSPDHHHHYHHSNHHGNDNCQRSPSSLLRHPSAWKGIIMLLLVLHSGWMLRQWLRLGNQLKHQEHQYQHQQSLNYDNEPLISSYYEKSHQSVLYNRLDQLRQRMESLHQQILEQQLQLYELSPPLFRQARKN